MKEKHLFNLYANYSSIPIERHDYFHSPDNCLTCRITFENETEFLEFHEKLGFTFYEHTPFGYYLFTMLSEQELDELQKKFEAEIEESRKRREEEKQNKLQELKDYVNKLRNREQFISKTFGGGGTRYSGLKVWINHKLIDRLVYVDEEKLEIKIKSPPWEGVKIIKTSKGSLVAVPDPSFTVINISAPKKYRVHSYVKLIDNLEVFEYWNFESPRGRVGTQQNVLVNVPKSVKSIRLKINDTEYVYDVQTGERKEIPPEEVF